MSGPKTVKLPTGQQMPIIGFGTWQVSGLFSFFLLTLFNALRAYYFFFYFIYGIFHMKSTAQNFNVAYTLRVHSFW